jgi:aconitate hydratase
LRDIWPSNQEIQAAVTQFLEPEMFRSKYADVFNGNQTWEAIQSDDSELYPWNETSTYIQEPPFFKDFDIDIPSVGDIQAARALAVFGDSITTDHISPAGSFSPESPAGKYLTQQGVPAREFNSSDHGA